MINTILISFGIFLFIVFSAYLVFYVRGIKKSLGKWDNPFDQNSLMDAQTNWQEQISKMQSDLNSKFIEVQREAQNKLIEMQKNLNTQKLMVIEGSETKKIQKSDMFDDKVLYCTEVKGMCKGERCGHYRQNVNGVDICRFNALEFLPD